MSVIEIPQLTYQGNALDMEQVGPLRRSDDALQNRDELWRRMREDGYLFLPGLLDRDEVLMARQELCDRLHAAGMLDLKRPVIEGIAAPKEQVDAAATRPFMPELARGNAPLENVVYDGAMMAFHEFFLDGAVRHFDYTWFRAKPPGTNMATTPHYDFVYMGRGTPNLCTAWTPYGDVPYEMGGLMVMEKSHQHEKLVQGYGQTDVDLYCQNEGEAEALVSAAQRQGRELTREEVAQIHWNSTGAYSSDAITTREKWGGRWLTAEYALGDVLIFCMHLMHASSDNQSECIRLSSDTRYQLASEPVDERWIGDNPAAHGIRAKRGMVC
jgi:hypothetical protein